MCFYKSVLIVFLCCSWRILSANCPDSISISDLFPVSIDSSSILLAEGFHECPILLDSLGLYYHKLGIKFYQARDYHSAISYTAKALQVRQSLYGDSLTIDLGKSFYNTGLYYRKIHKYTSAIKNLEEAVSVYKTIGNYDRVIRTFLEMGNVYHVKGEYQASVQVLNEALRTGDDNDIHKYHSQLYLNLSNAWKEIGDFDKSLSYNTQCVLLEAELSSRDIGLARNIRGQLCYLLNREADAVKNYLIAIDVFEESESYWDQAVAWNNLALVYIKTELWSKARQALSQGSLIAAKYEFQDILSQGWDNFMELSLAQDNIDDAIVYADNAVLAALNYAGSENRDYLSAPKKELIEGGSYSFDLLTAVSDKIKCLQFLYDLRGGDELVKSVRAHFDFGNEVIRQIRRAQIDFDSKLFWRKKMMPFYETSISFFDKIGDDQTAFHILERAKAVVLFESRLEAGYRELSESSSLNDLRKKIWELESIKNKSSVQNFELISAKNEILVERDKILGGLEYLKEYDLNKIISNSKIENLVYLDFWVAKESLYCARVSKDAVHVERVAIEPIRKETNRLREFIVANDLDSLVNVSRRLRHLIFNGIEISSSDEIVIGVDGILGFVPFDLLLNDWSTTEQYSIRYTYSVAYDMMDGTRRSNVGFEMLAPNREIQGGAFSSEFDIVKRYSDEIKVDQEATSDGFKNALTSKSVVHLSSHAKVDSRNNEAFIFLYDDTLNVKELYGYNYTSDLVVLSACETGIGEIASGEGVLSLGRALSSRGVGGIVTSLWPINAESTSYILEEFYRLLAEGRPPHEALGIAKRQFNLRKDVPGFMKTPYHWAGLVYYGDDQPIKLQPKSSSIWVWLLSGLVLISCVFLWNRRRSSGLSV